MTSKADTSNFKTAIHTASGHVQSTIAKTEQSALAAVDRVEDTVASVKSSLDNVKALGSQLTDVVDNAGRATVSGVVALNGSIMNYGKDLIADSIDVGRKTIETRSLKDAVELQTAFAERRIQALFQTAAQINSLAQDNVMAMWKPFASLVRTAGTQGATALTEATAEVAKASKFKSAA